MGEKPELLYLHLFKHRPESGRPVCHRLAVGPDHRRAGGRPGPWRPHPLGGHHAGRRGAPRPRSRADPPVEERRIARPSSGRQPYLRRKDARPRVPRCRPAGGLRPLFPDPPAGQLAGVGDPLHPHHLRAGGHGRFPDAGRCRPVGHPVCPDGAGRQPPRLSQQPLKRPRYPGADAPHLDGFGRLLRQEELLLYPYAGGRPLRQPAVQLLVQRDRRRSETGAGYPDV